MNAENIAEWFRRQGYHVVRTESSYWCNLGLRVYQAFPYHWVIMPSRDELRRFMLLKGVVGLRYSMPLNQSPGSISYHCIYENGTYDLPELPRRARNGVRKGLRNVAVEQISLEHLADEGWRLRVDTMQRQGRPNAERQDWWRRMCLTAAELPGFEAWGAFYQGKLAAALLAVSCDDCYTLLYQQSDARYLSAGVNNALAYVVTRNAINRPNISKVFYGLESLNASEDVDTFKLRMGYKPIPLRQRVLFHPALLVFINRYSHGTIQRLVHRYPEKTSLSKFAGMLRFFLNGRRPLDQQTYPAALMFEEEQETYDMSLSAR